VKLIANSIFAAFLLAVALPAQACTAPPPELTKHHRELVADSSQIVLARALTPRSSGGEPLPRFETIEILKGAAAAEFVLESRDGLDATTWAAHPYPFTDHDSDFNGHRDIAVWDQGLTRDWNDTDCMMRPRFEPGETYLLFVDHPHWRAYELIRREDDLWLRAVRNLIADPSRRSGLTVTVPQWLLLAPRAFVIRLNSCETPDIDVVDVLLGEGEAPFPDFRLQRPTRYYYGSRQDCEPGMRFLTLVYYQSEADPDYVVSANFDVENGTVDFSKAIDDEETELHVTGPKVWLLSDLREQLPERVEP